MRKRVTQVSETSTPAISFAKFLIIALVGGKWRTVRPSMYVTSSSSCCGVSLRCAIALSSHDACMPWSQRDTVDLHTLYFSARCSYGICLPGCPARLSATAALIDIVLLRKSGCKLGWLRCSDARYAKRALRAQTRYACISDRRNVDLKKASAAAVEPERLGSSTPVSTRALGPPLIQARMQVRQLFSKWAALHHVSSSSSRKQLFRVGAAFQCWSSYSLLHSV